MSIKPEVAPLCSARVRLRLLNADDLPMTLTWRNQDSIRKWFFNSEIIRPELHRAWFDSYLIKDNDFVFIIEELVLFKRAVGQLSLYNIEWAKKRAELGRLMIGDGEAQGMGIAKEAMVLAVALAENVWRLREIHLEVLAENIRAIGLYKCLGFTQMETIDRRVRLIRINPLSMHSLRAPIREIEQSS